MISQPFLATIFLIYVSIPFLSFSRILTIYLYLVETLFIWSFNKLG